MIRVYIIAVDSLNPLRPTFAALPSDKLIAGLEVLEEPTLPNAHDIAQAVADCIEIARTGKALPKRPEPPKMTSDERPGELDIPDPRLVKDASSWDETPDYGEAPSFEERFANVPDEFE